MTITTTNRHDDEVKISTRLVMLLGLLSLGTAAAQTNRGVAEVNGTRLYYESAGEGEAVILLHGALVDSRTWEPQFQELAKRYRVVRYDQRGHGRSGRNHAEPHSPAADLHALLEHLEISRAHIVGFSAGGSIAVDYALEHPERVLSLALIEPAVSGIAYAGEHAGLFVEMLAAARQNGPEAAAEMFIGSPFLATLKRHKPGFDVVAQAIRDHAFQFTQPKNLQFSDPPAATRLEELRMPTLLMVSEFADPHDASVIDRLQREIGPAHRLAIGGAGHVINLERPADFNRGLSEFIERTIADRRAAARLEAPRVLAVMFHADWCPTCKVIEPRLKKIERDFSGEPILFTQFDLTDDFTLEQSARFAALLGLESYLEQSSGRTGYMLLFDGATKKLLGEVRVKMSDDEIRAAFAEAIREASQPGAARP